ncbi:MAG: GNAT family N-acetyltransferase [Gemmatimonadales bacterium]
MNTDLNLGEATLRRAKASDAARLAEFGARTFSDTFAAENTPEDIALYLGRTYGAVQQAAEIDNLAMATILADVDGRLAGFAQMRTGPAPACVSGRAPIELLRFYVDRPWQGRGLARALMEEVGAEVVRRDAGVIWLAVWERNERAIAFYRKCGFRDVGSKTFTLGTDRQNDRVMARPVRSSPGDAA